MAQEQCILEVIIMKCDIQFREVHTFIKIVLFINLMQRTSIIRSVVYVDVTNAEHIPKVHSPFSCVLSVIVDRTLTAWWFTVSAHTIYRVLTTKISF